MTEVSIAASGCWNAEKGFCRSWNIFELTHHKIWMKKSQSWLLWKSFKLLHSWLRSSLKISCPRHCRQQFDASFHSGLRWKLEIVAGSYSCPFCLLVLKKNWDKRWSSSVIGRCFSSFICHTITFQLQERVFRRVAISLFMCALFCLSIKLSMAPRLSPMPVSAFYVRPLQIFRIIKFASWIFVFLVLILSSVKINLLGSFFAKMRALTRFLFVVLVAKFAGFREQKKIQSLWLFPWKWSVWQNPDQERTNQNARISLKTILPYNKMGY